MKLYEYSSVYSVDKDVRHHNGMRTWYSGDSLSELLTSVRDELNPELPLN